MEFFRNRNELEVIMVNFVVLSALDEIQQEEIDKREQGLRAQTIQEILSSEVSYLKQLETIMEVS